MAKKFDQEAAFKSIIGITGNGEKVEEKNSSRTDKETKRRVSLAVTPSLYKDLQKIAYVERKSVSEIVSELIKEYVAANVAKLEEYKKIKSE